MYRQIRANVGVHLVQVGRLPPDQISNIIQSNNHTDGNIHIIHLHVSPKLKKKKKKKKNTTENDKILQ